jgi:hypothetical protein
MANSLQICLNRPLGKQLTQSSFCQGLLRCACPVQQNPKPRLMLGFCGNCAIFFNFCKFVLNYTDFFLCSLVRFWVVDLLAPPDQPRTLKIEKSFALIVFFQSFKLYFCCTNHFKLLSHQGFLAYSAVCVMQWTGVIRDGTLI